MNEKAGSVTSKDGCNYGIDCPLKPRNSVPYCCGTCAKTKNRYLTDANRHLWTDKRGFHSPDGCKLARNEMPQECLDYDCRVFLFLAKLVYINGQWQAIEGMELYGDEITAVKLAVNETLRLYRGKDSS